MTDLSISPYIDLTELWFAEAFEGFEHAWDVLQPKFKEKWIIGHIQPNVADLPRRGHMLMENCQVPTRDGGTATLEAGAFIKGDSIELQDGAYVEGGAWICGPTIIGPHTEVRHGAYIRGGVLTGTDCVIGHATEVKSSIFANDAKAGHFAYVGDSILGNGVNLGAGTKISNLKIIEGTIKLREDDQDVDTGLRKFGAIVGDGGQIGCNAVLNPGTLLGRGCLVYPNVSVKSGLHKAKSRIKH